MARRSLPLLAPVLLSVVAPRAAHAQGSARCEIGSLVAIADDPGILLEAAIKLHRLEFRQMDAFALCHGRAKLAQLLGGFVVRPDRLRRLGEKRAIDFRDKRGN